MIEKYSVGFGHSARDSSTTLVNGRSRDDHVVVLTGSTGGLGSYMLASLLQRNDVSLIYAINRPSRDASSSIQQRQKSGFADRGLDVTLLHSEKLVYVVTDTSQDDLGLGTELYQKVCFISSLTG
jgi:thioester reductase-like protein